MQVLKIEDWDDIPDCYTGVIEWPDGLKEWWLNGKRHRDDGHQLYNQTAQNGGI